MFRLVLSSAVCSIAYTLSRFSSPRSPKHRLYPRNHLAQPLRKSPFGPVLSFLLRSLASPSPSPSPRSSRERLLLGQESPLVLLLPSSSFSCVSSGSWKECRLLCLQSSTYPKRNLPSIELPQRIASLHSPEITSPPSSSVDKSSLRYACSLLPRLPSLEKATTSSAFRTHFRSSSIPVFWAPSSPRLLLRLLGASLHHRLLSCL
mmetsp:Transcript_1148/g.3257  ORF Transcript_1148/g.3257 Transcript_1148/m.3257 type:complete len:205 (+) Transcript_1148:1838-2452(+)